MERSTIVLITGANAGLGFQMVRALYGSDEDYNILLGGRSLEKAEQAANAIKQEFPSTHSKIYPIQIDIEDDDSIQRAFNEVAGKFGRLDALVNNAGALLDPQIQTGALTMRQAWTASWTINTVGTQIVTATFMPLLLKSDNPRLLFLASGTSTLAGTENLNSPLNKVPAKGWPKTTATAFNNNIAAYRSAKCGMNMMMREWFRILHEDGVKVWCISPGYLATGLGGSLETNQKQGAGDPAIAGQLVRTVLEGKRDGDVGKVVTKDGIQPW